MRASRPEPVLLISTVLFSDRVAVESLRASVSGAPRTCACCATSWRISGAAGRGCLKLVLSSSALECVRVLRFTCTVSRVPSGRCTIKLPGFRAMFWPPRSPRTLPSRHVIFTEPSGRAATMAEPRTVTSPCGVATWTAGRRKKPSPEEISTTPLESDTSPRSPTWAAVLEPSRTTLPRWSTVASARAPLAVIT
jgi:hypothetical protein